jgi:hypothetical protein
MGRAHWLAAIWSGILAGIIFLVLEVVLWPLAGLGPPGEPIRMIAAILLGPDVLSAELGVGTFLAAMLVHFSLSTLYALGYAIFSHFLLRDRFRRFLPYAHGVFGLLIYLVNFYGFVTLFPWFIEARHDISVLVHVVWGMILPGAYDARLTRLARRREAA